MNILKDILEVKKEEVKKLKFSTRYRHFSDSGYFERDSLGFADALKTNKNISIIAEIKRASPSAGVLREEFDHREIANIYMEQGADAISILTDTTFFQGHLSFLHDVAGFKNVPLLRKDFIIDDYQVFESKAAGADAILLIAETLSPTQYSELYHAALECGLETLIEMHSAAQLQKLDRTRGKLIGINNRNLEDFAVDLNTTLEIAELLLDDAVIVSESGFHSEEDVETIKQGKVDAILVGEFLMKAEKMGEALIKFKEWCRRES